MLCRAGSIFLDDSDRQPQTQELAAKLRGERAVQVQAGVASRAIRINLRGVYHRLTAAGARLEDSKVARKAQLLEGGQPLHGEARVQEQPRFLSCVSRL